MFDDCHWQLPWRPRREHSPDNDGSRETQRPLHYSLQIPGTSPGPTVPGLVSMTVHCVCSNVHVHTVSLNMYTKDTVNVYI